MNKLKISELREGEADVLHAARLCALTDYPNPFADSLEDAQAKPSAYWQDLTLSLVHLKSS